MPRRKKLSLGPRLALVISETDCNDIISTKGSPREQDEIVGELGLLVRYVMTSVPQ